MPNINRIITLTAQGSNSGPLYDIYYSNDCVNYTLCIDGDNVSLPSIGSTAIITLPDTAICIKLVNLSEGCFLNEVVQYIGGITTTSTTTIGPPTTTSTTTAGPTTTTTTFSSNPCICTEVNITSEGGEVQTFNCYGVNENYVYLTAGTRYLCAAEIGGLLQAEIVSGTGTVTPVGNCKTGPCPPITTTTTAASTTTTTAAPTTTTTTYITTYLVEPCGGGLGPFIVTRASGDTPSGIGQAFKISGNTPAGFNGTTCWEILEIDPVGTIDYNNLAFGNVFSNCAACVPTTTTTSTTTTSTTTTTVAPTTTTTTYRTTYKVEPCGGGAGPFIITLGSGDTPSGIGQAFKISGNTPAGFNGITCWEVLEIDPVGTIDYNNLAFGSVFSNCAACNATTTTTTTAAPTTTTTSTTSTTTSTTTTTAAPTTTTTTYITTYKVEPCGGGAGPFIVTLGSGTTPSGIGQAFKISGNSGAGFNGITCWEVLEIDPVGTVDYTNLAFGSVFSNCAACVPTTTTTSTTTSTTSTTTQAPTTTTTTVCECVQSINIEVTSAGNVTYLDCFNEAQIQNVGIGPEVIGTPPTCVQRNTLSGTAEFTITEYGACCTASTTTTTTASPTTTTTTTASPTTTTTTAGEPVEYQIDNGASGDSASACSGATTTSIVYTQSGNTVPFVTMILYDSTALTTPFVGSSGWRKLTGPLGTYAVEINTSGEITNYVTC